MLPEASLRSPANLVGALLIAASRVNAATPADLEWLKSLPSDTESIKARGLSDDLIPELARFTRLRMLDFQSGSGVADCKVTDAGLSRLAGLDLPRLQILQLGSCDRLTDAGIEHIARIESLTSLSLYACPGVTDAGLGYIANLDLLEGLDLRGCEGISDAGLDRLAAMQNLKVLRLGGCTNISLEAVAGLRSRMPGCNVIKDDDMWAHQVSTGAQFRNLSKSGRWSGPMVMGASLAIIGFLSALLYIPLQVFALWKMRGGRRVTALIPVPVMAVVIGVTLVALMQESNLWPIVMIFCSPFAVAFLVILLVASRAATLASRA